MSDSAQSTTLLSVDKRNRERLEARAKPVPVQEVPTNQPKRFKAHPVVPLPRAPPVVEERAPRPTRSLVPEEERLVYLAVGIFVAGALLFILKPSAPAVPTEPLMTFRDWSRAVGSMNPLP